MEEVKKTPLNYIHHQLGAKMVNFHGWEMPIQYSGIIAEHRHTREKVSLFDVSHMGEVFFEGEDALANVQYLTTNDASKLAIGQAQYSALLYENGTFVDDITVYRLQEKKFMFCVNAGNSDKDFTWVKSKITGDCKCENRSPQYGQIAIQGPLTNQVVEKVSSLDINRIAYYHFAETSIAGEDVILARMGYTGEDGFEVFCDAGATEKIWSALYQAGEPHGIIAVGLGARDTLRLEVNYPLYGNDIDDQHTPLEAGLGWIVKMDKPGFIGKQALASLKEKGVSQKLVSFKLDVKGVPRGQYKIFDAKGEKEIGIVTSGTSSPSLKIGIGMGYVQKDWTSVGTAITIQVRDKFFPATVVQKPFVKRN